MKKKLLLLFLSFALCLPTFAESMCVNLKNGETVSFDLEDIKDITICENISVVDESDTPLKFKILSENTVEVIRDDSYSELSSVTIPAKVRIDGKVYDVTSIGVNPFWRCSSLTSIEIPNSVTSIGDYAFYECTGLTSINIPECVTAIGDYAFWRCSSLTNIEIPNSVTAIGEKAFYECTGLDVVIDNSKNNVKVGYDVFKRCKSVTWLKDAVDVSDTPLKFKITSNSTVEVMYDGSYRDLDSIFIPAKVRIDGKVYDVTSIGEKGFYECTGLDIVIDNLEEIVKVGYDAFKNCKSVKWLKDVVDVSDTPLNFKITSDSTAEVMYDRFYKNLDSIFIPAKVRIDGKVYDVTSIGNGAFYECTGLTSIHISNSVTSIITAAFSFCSGLTSIHIPNSVTSIGDRAFYECTGLTNINIPNSVTDIGNGAFGGCSSLTNINIPESVTSVGQIAFMDCPDLDIVIDNSEDNVEVGRNAFLGCKSVTWLKEKD